MASLDVFEGDKKSLPTTSWTQSNFQIFILHLPRPRSANMLFCVISFCKAKKKYELPYSSGRVTTGDQQVQTVTSDREILTRTAR